MWIRNGCIAAIIAAWSTALALGAAPQHEMIKPPAGWAKESMAGTHSTPLGQVLEQWLSYDRGSEEYVEVGKRQSYGFNSDSFAEAYRAFLNQMHHHIQTFKNVTLCSGEVGWFVTSRWSIYEITGGKTTQIPEATEDVFYVDGTHVYFATYNYRGNLPPAPGAELAIHSLCIPAPVHVKPLVLPVSFSPPPGFLMSNPKETGVPTWPDTVAMFFDPNRRNDVIMLVRDRAVGEVPSASEQAQEKAAEAYVQRENHNAKEDMLSYDTYGMQPLCGDYNGVLFKYTVAYGKLRLAYEHMILYGPTLYSAVYIHPVSQPAYRPASDSLKTICPLATPSPSSATPSETPSESPMMTPPASPSPTVSP